MNTVLQDMRYAIRQLRHAPGFTLTAVIVLALGLGANIAVFTVLNGILLRPLPYADGNRIVTIDLVSPMPYFSMTYGNMLALRDAVGPKLKIGVEFNSSMASVVGPGGRVQVERSEIDAGLLDMLGVQPMLGRGFRADENNPGRNRVVLLGEDVWRKLYHADPGILGKTLAIRGVSYTVVGVMPRTFSFPFGDPMEIWSPQELTAANRNSLSFDQNGISGSLFARLPEGMTVAQLTAALDRAQALIAKRVPNDDTLPAKVKISTYQESMNHQARKPLLLLYAVVFGIWALACLNVTNLMLARSVARSREQAVRSALGASRLRLLKQSIIESLVLSSIGAVAGLLLGEGAIKLLWRQIAHRLPLTSTIHVDWRVVVCLGALTLVTGVLTGMIPALRAAGRNVQAHLHGVSSTASAGQNRAREVLVVGQIALTLVFLAGAGLFLRTLRALREVPLGFTQQNVLTGGIILNGANMLTDGTAGQPNIVQTAYRPLLEKLRAIPGVQVAALSSVLPLRSEFEVDLMTPIDHKKVPYPQTPRSNGRLASAGLVEALGIPMERGRFFSEDDTAGSPPVAVINQAFAKKYLAGQDPIGHTVSMGKGRFANARIVGVIGDVKQANVVDATRPELYFCLAQMQPGDPLYGIATAFIQVAIRAAVPADSLRAQFDRVLHQVAPDATTTNVETIHEAVENSFGSQTLIAHLLEGFAGIALMIATVGLYGLLSFSVAQRTREIGVRIALGAPEAKIVGLVMRRALLLSSAGLALGAVLAWFAVKLERSYIFGVQPHDAITFISVMLVLAAASLIAAWLPARRAAAVDPILALRSE